MTLKILTIPEHRSTEQREITYLNAAMYGLKFILVFMINRHALLQRYELILLLLVFDIQKSLIALI